MRHLHHRLLLLALAFAAAGALRAQPQEFVFDHLTIDDGLPIPQVVDIVQDHQGFMWLATPRGLVRYDGYDVTVFRHDSLDASSISHDRVECLYVDRSGTLWVGSNGNGLNRYDPVTETFTRYLLDANDPQSLSGGMVTVILEDTEGALWVGTQLAGLNRMDREAGTFAHYRHDPNDPASLSSNTVRVLYEDRAGTLWVGTGDGYLQLSRDEGGLNRFDRTTETFTRYLHAPDDPTSLIDGRVGALFEDSRGRFWVGTHSLGLHTMDRESGTFTHHAPDPLRPEVSNPWIRSSARGIAFPLQDFGGVVRFIHEDRTGALWVGAYGGGLDRYDEDAGTYAHFEADPDSPNGLLANTVWASHESRDGTVWIATWSGVTRVYPVRGRYAHHFRDPERPSSLPYNEVNAFHEGRDGALWVGTWGGGLSRMDPATGRFEPFRHNPADRSGLPLDTLSALAGDATGALWVGTWGEGVSRMDPATGQFEHHRHDPEDPGSLSDDWVRSMLVDRDGEVWVGTRRDGLNRLDPATGRVTRYGPPPSRDLREMVPRLDRYDDEGRSLAAILRVGNNADLTEPFDVERESRALIFATTEPTRTGDGDYGWLEDASGRVVWDSRQAVSLSGDEAGIRIQVDTLLLAPGRYHLRYRTDTNYGYADGWSGRGRRPMERSGYGFPPDVPERYGIQVYGLPDDTRDGSPPKDETDGVPSISGLHVTALFEDRAGGIWVGTDGGLDRYDKTTDTFTHYALHRDFLWYVAAMAQDRQGRLSLALQGEGIYRLDPATGALTRVDLGPIDQDSRWTRGLLIDEQGALWVSSYGHVARIDVDTGAFRIFTVPISQFYWHAHLRSRSGLLYFGGNDGFVTLDPTRMINAQPPDLLITGLRVRGEEMKPGDGVLDRPVWQTPAVTLGHDQRDVTLDFVGMHYNEDGAVTYAHLLDGYDAEWIDVGQRRSARYVNLPPGAYTFRVRAANADNVFSDDVTLDIRVLPPWWRTWWAYSLYLVLFVAAAVGAFRAQHARIVRRERERTRERELEQAHEIERAYHQLEEAHAHLKTTQQQLVQSEKMASLGQLTAGIAHEIKNPLNFVNNFAEVNEELARELRHLLGPTDEDTADLLNDLVSNARQIARHGKRADAIVQGMMAHASGGTGERYRVEVNPFVEEYVKLAYHGLHARKPDVRVAIERRFDEAVTSVEMVPQEVGRALLNVLQNAFEAVGDEGRGEPGSPDHVQGRQRRRGDGTPDLSGTRKGVQLNAPPAHTPTVIITTRRLADAVEIRVTDNGVGIPEEIREKIFEPFFTTKPTAEGRTGLGLSLAYDIVTQGHGGSLTVEDASGGGTTFVITLPQT